MTTDTQQRMPGTYDEPVKAVQEKAEEYAGLLRDRMQTQERENVCRAELIAVMKEHDRTSCELDGDIVTLEHVEQDKIKVKSKPAED